MRLAYITNIKIPCDNAQSIQAKAMARAFYTAIGDNFLFISPQNHENKSSDESFWKRIKINLALPRFLRHILLCLKSRRYVKQFNPDYIYSRDIFAVLFFLVLGFKTCYEIHKPFETFWGNRIFNFISHKIKIVSISQALQFFIEKQYSLSSPAILTAHDGVFLQDFTNLRAMNKSELRKELFGEVANLIVLYAGSLQTGKGIDVIEKVSELCKQENLPVSFYVIGGPAPATPAPTVVFLGRKTQSQVLQYLVAADVLVLPTTVKLEYHLYTSPLKLFEYMASGSPIISSSVGSITEVLNTNNAEFFDPQKIETLVLIIKDYVRSKAAYLKKAHQALEDIQEYDWNKRAEKIIQFLCQ